MDEIIKVNDVSMRFNLAQEKTETLKEYTVKLLTHKLFFNEFYALKHVSFSMKRGESLALIGRNCEYLEQHFDRTGADASTRQAVADINTAAMQLDRTLSEAITLLEFLHEYNICMFILDDTSTRLILSMNGSFHIKICLS